jgi:hypothetical protein
MVKTDYEKYIDDILKISPISRFVYGKKDKTTLSHIENSLSDDYFNDINKIITKFEDTTDIELKKELNCIKYNLENKLYLFIYSSYYNFIVNFIYNTTYIYPKNEEANLILNSLILAPLAPPQDALTRNDLIVFDVLANCCGILLLNYSMGILLVLCSLPHHDNASDYTLVMCHTSWVSAS